jgi:3-hydroxyacyl-CoA dehydrogenase
MMDNKKPATNSIGAGVIGAAVGAAAAVAVTKIMSDPEMKTKATDALQKAKQYALDSMQQMKSKTQEMAGSAEDIVDDTKRMTRTPRGAKSV